MTSRLNRLLIILIAAITVIGAVVWDVYTPYCSDDCYYRMIFKPNYNPSEDYWLSTNIEIRDFGDAWESIVNHCRNNGRLANIAHILFQPTGRLPEALFLGLCIGALFILTWCIARKGGMQASPMSAALVVVTIWTVLPWFDDFQSLDFQFNYVVPSVVLLFMIYIYPPGADSCQHRVLLFVLGIICSWLNEGFACVGAAYFLTIGILDRNIRTMSVAVSGLGVGLVINMLLGTATRISQQPPGYHFDSQTCVRLVLQLWPYMLSIAASVLTLWLCNKKKRAQIFRKIFPLLSGATAGVMMAIMLWRAERVLWYTDLFCILNICIIAGLVLNRVGRVPQLIFGCVFLLIYGWWMTQLCIWEKRIGDEIRKIEAIHGTPGNGASTIFFTEYTPESKIPHWLFGIVKQNIDNEWGQESMGSYLWGEEGSMLVMPEKLKDRPFEKWPKIPGNNNIRGVYPMLASRESTDSVFMLTFGRPENNISPANRLLMWIKGIDDKEIQVHGVAVPARLQTADSTKLYRLPFESMPRTAAGRPLLSIDRIPHE